MPCHNMHLGTINGINYRAAHSEQCPSIAQALAAGVAIVAFVVCGLIWMVAL